MDRRYEVYCLAGGLVYDRARNDPRRAQRVRLTRRGVARRMGSRHELEGWVMHLPQDRSLPAQGWKIHVSACLDNAERGPRHASGTTASPPASRSSSSATATALLLRNAKYADRGASGKFVTIYPADEAAARDRAHRARRRCSTGQPGPYILSDLRWGDGPLYVRYGGFAERYCLGASGELELGHRRRSGELVPDRARPDLHAAAVGDAARRSSQPHLEAPGNSATVDRPAVPHRAGLHFSNGGGALHRRRRAHRRAGRPQGGPAARRARRRRRRRGDPAAATSATCSRGWPASTSCRRCATTSRSATTSSWSHGVRRRPTRSAPMLVERYPLRRPTRRRGGHRRVHGVGPRHLRPGRTGRRRASTSAASSSATCTRPTCWCAPTAASC